MKSVRIRGTFDRTFMRWLDTEIQHSRKLARLRDGHMWTTYRSTHLSPIGRKLNRLRRLFFHC